MLRMPSIAVAHDGEAGTVRGLHCFVPIPAHLRLHRPKRGGQICGVEVWRGGLG
jgi:hypothetical protein